MTSSTGPKQRRSRRSRRARKAKEAHARSLGGRGLSPRELAAIRRPEYR
jgi:hypothetical protein